MLPPGELSNLPVVAGDVGHSRIEPRFGRVATALAGEGDRAPLLVDGRLAPPDA
jgi:hypothetical protein